jgi:hypothetical protein
MSFLLIIKLIPTDFLGTVSRGLQGEKSGYIVLGFFDSGSIGFKSRGHPSITLWIRIFFYKLEWS